MMPVQMLYMFRNNTTKIQQYLCDDELFEALNSHASPSDTPHSWKSRIIPNTDKIILKYFSYVNNKVQKKQQMLLKGNTQKTANWHVGIHNTFGSLKENVHEPVIFIYYMFLIILTHEM